MRRLSSLSSTTRIFFSDMRGPLFLQQYADGCAVSQTVDVDLLRTFRLGPRDAARADALRAESHRCAASRERAYRAVQLPLRAPSRGPLRPPHRGHGSRALDGRVDARDRRGARVARP